MERFGFGAEIAVSPHDDLLEAVTIAPLTPPMASVATMQAAILHIAPNGRIRRHPARVPQILAVLEGSGEVSGGSGAFGSLAKGDAVYFSEGEEHETRTTGGLVALVIEGAGVAPFRR